MAPFEARREHELIDVAGSDVFLRPPHRLGMRMRRKRGHRRRKAGRIPAGMRHAGSAEARHVNGRNAAAQGVDDLAAQAQTLGLAAVVEQRDAARQVIEDQQRARRDIVSVGSFGPIETAARHALEVADGVVGRIADQPAGERHARDIRQRLRRQSQCGPQRIQELGLRAGTGGMHAADGEAVAIQLHLQAIAETDERVARQALPALDALQQETRLERRQFQIGRNRRIQVGGDVER